MRSLSLGTTLVLCAAVSGFATGCKAPSQLVLGFATDLSAPNAIDTVQMHVYGDAHQLLDSREWILPGTRDKNFRLPGSFTLYADGGAEPTVNVELVGLKGGVPVVTRTNSLGLLTERSLFFRMTLVERCGGMVCGDGESCIEGKCKNNLVNLVSLRAYESGQEAFVQCSSGPSLTDTGTHEAMSLDGSGFCAADQWCGDATCYRNQGQGLLWCSPEGFSCKGIDGYESCLVGKCQPELASCYGADWRRGHFAGPCADYATCKAACACDSVCVSKCDADRPSACAACIDGSGGVTGCLATADAACSGPTCTLIAGAMSNLDAGAPSDLEPVSLEGLVMLAQGTYTIGCNLGDLGSVCQPEESPAHQVNIGGIYIDIFEVTQTEYADCVTASVCNAPPSSLYMPTVTPDFPVTSVTFYDAVKFCTWFGGQRGGQGRLPSEAEWEIAAHGVAGRMVEGLRYPWGDTDPTDCSLAQYSFCDPPSAAVAGSHHAGASAFGLEDLAGNAAEWVNDWFDATWYAKDAAKGIVMNPMGPPPGSGEKVVRGGNWTSTSTELRATSRQASDPGAPSDTIGFRCAFLPM